MYNIQNLLTGFFTDIFKHPAHH